MERGFIPVESIADRERYPFLDDDHRDNLRAAGVASFLGERLAVGEKKLGVIYFAFGAARKFSEWEREMARALTYQAALALNNAELMAEVREAMESAAAVAEITTLGELPQVMDSIAEQFARALHCDTVTLYAYDAERDQFLFPPATLGLRDREGVLALRYVEMGSAVGRVMALGEARFSPDARSDPLLNQGKFLEREGVRSTVAVPLQDREGKVGALFLGYRNLHQFTPHEEATVDLLVNQAAIGIRNAELYQRTQDDARVRKAIQEASRKISRARSLDETLEQVAHEALALSGSADVEGCFAHVALKSGNWLRFMSASQPDILARLRSELGDIDLNGARIGLTGQVALTGAAARVDDIAPHRAGGGNYLELDHRTRSESACH